MKTFFSTIVFALVGCLFLSSCKEISNENEVIDENVITACDVNDPAKNLPWLVKLIEKAKTDNAGHYQGRIWLDKFQDQDIFITDMMLGSGGTAYWFFDCSGNHFVSKDCGYEYCPACKFVGNHHVVMETDDLQSFISTIKRETIIYSPY
jgi:hypothetical protein